MEECYSIVSDYLQSNNLLKSFLHNEEHYSQFKRTHYLSNEPISSCFIWSRTSEGRSFWLYHNDKLVRLLKEYVYNRHAPTIQELLDALYNKPATANYEYW